MLVAAFAAVAAVMPCVTALTAAVTITAMSTLRVGGGSDTPGAPVPPLPPPPLPPPPPPLPPPPGPVCGGPDTPPGGDSVGRVVPVAPVRGVGVVVVGTRPPKGGVGGVVMIVVGKEVINNSVVSERVVAEVAPPRMQKVEVYLVGKVQDRCVMIVLPVKAFSSRSTVINSRRVQIDPPTNLSSSRLVKLACSHLIEISP